MMRFLFSPIWFVTLSLSCISGASQRQNTELNHDVNVVRLEFMHPVNCNVWVLNPKDNDPIYMNGTKPKKTFLSKNITTLTFEKKVHLKIKGIEIITDQNVILMNGTPLTNHINILIDDEGNIKPGYFYRTFK